MSSTLDVAVGEVATAHALTTGGGGDASTNTASSVDSEVALFSGTGGKTIKRATGSGLAVLTSGVLSTSTTSTAATLGTLELGAASDTTIARSGAGDITIDGNVVYRAGGTDVPVTDGGTGRSTSTTAYGLIAAGTTATGAQQTLAAGGATDVLVGGGASALPAWTTATGSGAPVRGTSPTITNPTVTNYTESVVAIGNTSTAKTIDLTSGTVQTATLTGNCTFTMPSVGAGKSFTLLLSTGAGSFTATFTSVKWNSAGAPTITAAASKLDIVSFISDGTNWYGSISQGYTP